MSTKARIQEAAGQNEDLLRVLAETERAAPALARHQQLMANLAAQIAESDARIQALDLARQKELKEHEKMQGSVVKRLAYRATGKTAEFQAKARQEEAEYFLALEAQHRETETNDQLRVQLLAQGKLETELTREAARHGEAQQALDELYEGIFAGPTPGFPDEDRKEEAATSAAKTHREVAARAEGENRAVGFLGEARQRAEKALPRMDRAMHYSKRHPLNNGVGADLCEGDALFRATMDVIAARSLVIDAQSAINESTKIPMGATSSTAEMPSVTSQFHSWTTDTAFQEEIKRATAEVRCFVDAVAQLLAQATERKSQIADEVGRCETEVKETRRALQEVREEAFERVVASKENLKKSKS
ncbi:hypothetical protein B0H63DRAFT_394988 [Podospora didyma]|uniref:Uncharacterized protein n=1 Tax=Podospora didyma TaxID=330526 RepID=A0AAE0NQB1_9PEZI|nr:hypothetical protein B0H63DRAFT_394988 [Podospora didyma]